MPSSPPAPKTEKGKRIASHNALKTGLTGRTILLPTDDLAEYESHLHTVHSRYAPKTDEEKQLTGSIAHIEWRLQRIPTLETALLALGRKQFADHHDDETGPTRRALIEAEVLLAYGKQLSNLALQESRLLRQHEKQTARLDSLLKTRKAAEQANLNELASLYEHCRKEGMSFDPNHLGALGFEFSFDDLKRTVVDRVCRATNPKWPNIAIADFVAHFDLAPVSAEMASEA